MATGGDRAPMGRRAKAGLRAAAVLVIVGGLGIAWMATRPSVSKLCTLGASIDEVGAATPEAARIRWAAQLGLDVDIEAPDRVSGSGDRVTARYHLEAPDVPVADPDRTWFQEVVTERDDDGVWRVASANECQQWTIA